jgi:undecaprenyl phosphate-alpha-L-ara4N flippase subunit ArnE
LITILLRSLATIFAKKAAIISSGQGLEGIIINIWTGAELFTLILQAILWSHVLNKFHLNKVYPYMSLVYGVNLAAAWIIFNEVISMNHIVGITVIVLGIAIMNSYGRVSSDLK